MQGSVRFLMVVCAGAPVVAALAVAQVPDRAWPMHGGVESLGVASAGAVASFELARRR